MLESVYQSRLIRRLYHDFEGCEILKNDTSYRQGIPDLTIFYGPRWAVLEVKASAQAPERPNQRYYVDLFNQMSFAAFIYPENEDEVLHALQQALKPRRASRLP